MKIKIGTNRPRIRRRRIQEFKKQKMEMSAISVEYIPMTYKKLYDMKVQKLQNTSKK